MVNLLLELGANIDAETQPGCTPLRSAVTMGWKSVAQLLLKNGAKVAPRDKNGRTPLHTAAETGDVEMVRLLLRVGQIKLCKTIMDEG